MKYIHDILGIAMKDGVTRTYRIKNNLHLAHIWWHINRYDVPHKMVHILGLMVEVDEKDLDTELLNKLMKHVIED